MTISEAIRIIKSENLTHFNLYEQRPYRERELTLQHIDGKWNVFMTDERACIFPPSEIIFDNESDALMTSSDVCVSESGLSCFQVESTGDFYIRQTNGHI